MKIGSFLAFSWVKKVFSYVWGNKASIFLSHLMNRHVWMIFTPSLGGKKMQPSQKSSFLISCIASPYVLRIGQTHVTEKLSSDADREDEAYLTVCLINRLTSLNINQIMTQNCSCICQMNGPIIITNPVLSSQNFKTFDTLYYSIVLGKSWLID